MASQVNRCSGSRLARHQVKVFRSVILLKTSLWKTGHYFLWLSLGNILTESTNAADAAGDGSGQDN